MESYVGQIMLFAFAYPPEGWAVCNGQLLSIAEYDTLYSLIGTTYGGDGMVTFALPDLRGRVPIHFGQLPGGSNYVLGQMAGAETETLLPGHLPPHVHSLQVSGAGVSTESAPASDRTFGVTNSPKIYTAPGGLPTSVLDVRTVSLSGGNQPHDNIMPSLVANYCISLYGIYPSFS